VSPLAIRRRLRRSRHTFAALALVVALGGAVAVAHGAPGAATGMDGMHGLPAAAGLAVCLGVLPLGAALARRRWPSWPAPPHPDPRVLPPRRRLVATTVAAPARAGPDLTVVLRR
jgi:peptidoglycan/LPS O-acetylase OafA/YrhL